MTNGSVQGTTAAEATGTVHANGIEIAYETFGSPEDPALLLVMGLGTQMIAWPDQLCADLAGHGLFVIRFDNRDSGLSTHLDGTPPPSYLDVLVKRARPPYTIEDMAEDAVGLLDGLGVRRAHVVGASMGGFIAQALALRHPSRVATLTLIMTSTGSRFVGNPKVRVFWSLLRRRVAADRASALDAALEIAEIIGSKGYAFDQEQFGDYFHRAYDRAYDFDGYLRQLAAIGAQTNRGRQLGQLRMPALVIHGLHDPLVAVSGGLALARRLRHATFVGFSGMGHDLPRDLWPAIVSEIATLTAAHPIPRA